MRKFGGRNGNHAVDYKLETASYKPHPMSGILHAEREREYTRHFNLAAHALVQWTLTSASTQGRFSLHGMLGP